MKKIVSIWIILAMVTSNLGFAYAGDLMPSPISTTKAIGAGYPSYDVQGKGKVSRPAHKAEKLKVKLALGNSDKESKPEVVKRIQDKMRSQVQETEMLRKCVSSLIGTIGGILGSLGGIINNIVNPMGGISGLSAWSDYYCALGLLDYYFNELIKYLDKLFREMFEGDIEINRKKRLSKRSE